ncbi:MAG: hypothetical protein MZV64_59740 [Ignavibacteriales bacterium]|nr:hypothetical protein [Ignavibacteriales bacterium]
MSNNDTAEHRRITARLVYITLTPTSGRRRGKCTMNADVKRLMDTFENEMYPTNREFFGRNSTPALTATRTST